MEKWMEAFSGYKTRKRKTIKFEVNQDSATLWYHPPPSPNTAKQVYNGLSGLLYIEDSKRIIILVIMEK